VSRSLNLRVPRHLLAMVRILAALLLAPALGSPGSEIASVLQVTTSKTGSWPDRTSFSESSSASMDTEAIDGTLSVESETQAVLQAEEVVASTAQVKGKAYVEWTAASELARASHNTALLAKAQAEDAAKAQAAAAEKAQARLSQAARAEHFSFAASAAEGSDGAAVRARADAQAIAETQREVVATAQAAAEAFGSWEAAVQKAQEDESNALTAGAAAEVAAAAAEVAWAAASNNAALLRQRAQDIPSEGQDTKDMASPDKATLSEQSTQYVSN